MTWKGQYVLELTCDRNGGGFMKQPDGTFKDTLGHIKGEFPYVFTGEQGTVVRSEARKAGWMIGQRGIHEAVCPRCRGYGRN